MITLNDDDPDIIYRAIKHLYGQQLPYHNLRQSKGGLCGSTTTVDAHHLTDCARLYVVAAKYKVESAQKAIIDYYKTCTMTWNDPA